MITKFGSLWAGNVDMDNPGYQGTPANDRWLSDEELAGGGIEKAEKIAIAMDRLGYDTFWAAEHHFQREGYEGDSQPADAVGASGAPDRESALRLRLQHQPDVEPSGAWPRTMPPPTG